jgi:thiol-disulfide isomerase/thioredoxin
MVFSANAANNIVLLFLPQCGFSKAMAPAWEKLAEEWDDDSHILVAQVECGTYEFDHNNIVWSDPLCQSKIHKGVPVILYGEPQNLREFEVTVEERVSYEKLSQGMKQLIDAHDLSSNLPEGASKPTHVNIIIGLSGMMIISTMILFAFWRRPSHDVVSPPSDYHDEDHGVNMQVFSPVEGDDYELL